MRNLVVEISNRTNGDKSNLVLEYTVQFATTSGWVPSNHHVPIIPAKRIGFSELRLPVLLSASAWSLIDYAADAILAKDRTAFLSESSPNRIIRSGQLSLIVITNRSAYALAKNVNYTASGCRYTGS